MTDLEETRVRWTENYCAVLGQYEQLMMEGRTGEIVIASDDLVVFRDNNPEDFGNLPNDRNDELQFIQADAVEAGYDTVPEMIEDMTTATD